MAAFTLGVAHPPSYPLHTLLGHLFCFIPLGNPSFQFNFLSSILGAAGAVLLTVNAWILLAPILRPKTSNGKEHLVLPLVSIFGGLLLAYSKIIGTLQSRPKEVFTFSKSFWPLCFLAEYNVWTA